MATPSGGRLAPNGADAEMRAAEVEGHESEGDESLGDGGSFATHVSDDEDADDSRAEMGGGDASDWAHSGRSGCPCRPAAALWLRERHEALFLEHF